MKTLVPSLDRAQLLGSILLLTAAVASGQSLPWKFVAVGDTRSAVSSEAINTVIVSELADQIVSQGAAFVVIPGDLVYAGSMANFQTWRNAMAKVYQAGIGVYPVLGNHDANDAASFITVFGSDLPDNGPAGEVNRTYSFTHDNVLFLALDTYVNVGRVNQAWVDSILATNTRPHVFTFGHMPAFKANHTDCLDDYPTQRDAFWNSLRTAGAAAYFCGHDHFYDHARINDGDGILANDVHQLIVGGGGAPLYTSYAYDGANTSWTPVNVFHENQYGYTLVEIDGLNVTMTYYHRTGTGSYAATSDVWSYTVSSGPAVPPPPAGLRAIAGNAQVALSWNPSTGATHYRVRRAAGSPSGTWDNIALVPETSYTDTTAVNGTTYYYAVTALNSAGESASSPYVSATPQAAPGAFTLTAVPAKRAIALTWTASSGASSYTVKRATAPGGPFTVLKSSTTALKYNDAKVRSGSTYYYVVTAVSPSAQTDSNVAAATAR